MDDEFMERADARREERRVREVAMVGRRVRVTGTLPDDPSSLEIGDEGVVTDVFGSGTPFTQIVVKWDSGRTLMLLPGDPFEVLP